MLWSFPSSAPFSSCFFHCLVHSAEGRLTLVGLDSTIWTSAREERLHVLPRLSLGRYRLPWAPATINQSAVVVPVDAARGRGCACAKAADGSTSRGVGTSVTARMRNASGRFAAGRQRGGRPSAAWMPRLKHSMPRPNACAASAPNPCPKHRRMRKLRRRVVTQRNFFSTTRVRPAGVPRTAASVDPQPGTLLLRCLPSGGSQCFGS